MNEETTYPGVTDRIKAVAVDTFILVLFMFIASIIFSKIENVNENYRIAAFVFIFGIYDPLFTSLFGGTLGHISMGIKVKRLENHKKNVFFPVAFIRFLMKVILGWLSLVTLGNNDKNQAIHDLAVHSVVLYRKKPSQ